MRANVHRVLKLIHPKCISEANLQIMQKESMCK
jgi:hypothetical protein